MKTNKGFAPIALVLILVAVLAVGGVAYYIGKKSNAPTTNQENNQSQDSNIQINESKNYSNDELGVSFSYPKEWGEVLFSKTAGDKGFMFRGKFSQKESIAFGGVSKDFTQGRGADDYDIREFGQSSFPVWFYQPTKESISGMNVSGELYTQTVQGSEFYSIGTMMAYFPLKGEQFKAIGFGASDITPKDFKDFLITLSINQDPGDQVLGDQYKIIPEFGIKYKITPENKDIYYVFKPALKKDNFERFNEIHLFSRKISPSTNPESYWLFVITQYTEGQLGYKDEVIQANQYNRKLGNFIYVLSGHQAPCMDEVTCQEIKAARVIYDLLELI